MLVFFLILLCFGVVLLLFSIIRNFYDKYSRGLNMQLIGAPRPYIPPRLSVQLRMRILHSPEQAFSTSSESPMPYFLTYTACSFP